MAIEDEVVGSTLKIATTLIVGGAKLAVEIVGAGAMLAGLTYKAISKKINQKKANKEVLTGGEVTFEKIMQSGEDIHAVWLNEADVENFTMLAKRMGIPFFAVKNGDELEKSRGFLRKNKDDNQFVFFSDEYSNMVSISYRASDEVRMAHILEMFPTFNPAQVSHTQTPEQTLTEGQEEASTPLDDVERFMEENGVEVERPPEVVAYEEVNKKNERASETNLPDLSDEKSREHMEVGDNELLCFSTFGFTETPTQAEFDEAYSAFMEKNGLNPDEPNVFTALHEQGSKIISGEVTPSKPEFVAIKADEKVESKKGKSELPECFKTLGFDKMPTSVQEVKDKYFQFVENAVSLKNPEKVANEAFAACLKHLEKSESVRTKLEAKRERNSLSGTVGEAVERAAEQAANKVAKKSMPQLAQ